MRLPLANLVLGTLATACGQPAPVAAPSTTADAIPPLIQAFRDATGGAAWDRVAVIHTKATAEIGGLVGTVDSIEDVATGRHRTTLSIAGMTQADGFDGQHAWEQSPGGEVVAPDAPEALALARTAAWLTRHGYFRAGGARYRSLGERRDHDVHLRGLEATPDGGTPVQLWFDDAGLVVRTVERDGIDTTTTELGDWRDIGGVRVPFRTVSDQGDPRTRAVATTVEVHIVAPLPETTWARPALDTARLTFRDGATSTEVPFDLVNNHIYIRAAVDGKPVRLIVDTGGVNMLTPAAVKRLGLHADGTMAASGVGAEKVDMAIAHAQTITVGGAELAAPVIYVIDTGPLADVEGEDFDGLVGFELFERLAVRIDYPAHRLTLTRPTAFVPPAKATVVPFEMRDKMPLVDGSIDGLPARFRIDTGDRGSVTTLAAFTRTNHLDAKYHPAFETLTGWGVGGSVRSSPVRFHEVKVGAAAVHEVVGDLFTGDAGAMADPDASANLGGEVLRRFVVSFDYATKHMYLEPVAGLDVPEIYDRSGVGLIRDGATLRVVGTIARGPGELAGLAVGDRITHIDGEPVAARPIAQWRARFRESPVGKRVAMKFQRGGTERTATLTLAELIP